MSAPVAVLDAAVLVPAGLRDVLLSMADAGVFRPVWQTEIEAEIRRNIVVVERRRDRARGKQRAAMTWSRWPPQRSRR